MGNDLRKLITALEDQGYIVSTSAKGHYLVSTEHGRRVAVLAGTPSDRRGIKNAISRLRRSGFVWPPTR
jgi:hypothetical protein